MHHVFHKNTTWVSKNHVKAKQYLVHIYDYIQYENDCRHHMTVMDFLKNGMWWVFATIFLNYMIWYKDCDGIQMVCAS